MCTSYFAAAVWAVTTPPIYTATATLRIEKEEPRVLTFDEVSKQIDPLPDALLTQQRLLQSRTLANRVIARLGLASVPEFADDSTDPLTAWMDTARGWVRGLLNAWTPAPPTTAIDGTVVCRRTAANIATTRSISEMIPLGCRLSTGWPGRTPGAADVAPADRACLRAPTRHHWWRELSGGRRPALGPSSAAQRSA